MNGGHDTNGIVIKLKQRPYNQTYSKKFGKFTVKNSDSAVRVGLL